MKHKTQDGSAEITEERSSPATCWKGVCKRSVEMLNANTTWCNAPHQGGASPRWHQAGGGYTLEPGLGVLITAPTCLCEHGLKSGKCLYEDRRLM